MPRAGVSGILAERPSRCSERGSGLAARVGIARRTPNRKRDLNRPKNIVWDSPVTPVQAPPNDSRPILERIMHELTLILSLLIASLTNVVCLYACL